MHFGDDKARQMARSILPSTWRGAPAERARLHRGERRGVKQTMRALMADPEAWFDDTDADETCDVEVHILKRDRRSSDKLNHFERWAIERTRALPVGARLGEMRRVLPGGLIGDHAMVHLKQRKELNPRLERWRWKRRSIYLDRGEQAALLRRILVTPGAHRVLHLVLRRAKVNEQPAIVPAHLRPVAFRPLHGLGDVLPFLDAHQKSNMRSTRVVLDRFLRAFKAARCDPMAAARAMSGPTEVPVSDDRWVEA